MVRLEKKFIPESRANRRAYAPGSAYYQKFRIMDYITIHDVGSDGYERGYDPDWFHWYIAVDKSTENPARNRKAWHFTVGSEKVIQHLRVDEVGLHAGDGLFGGVLNGNSNSIGIEMCKASTKSIQDRIITNTAWLCSQLIKQNKVGKRFPEGMKQHFDWTQKNCPAVLRSRPNGWNDFLDEIDNFLNPTPAPAPEIDPNLFYRVIAGSYNEIENARRVETELKNLGYSAFILPFRRGGS